MYKRQNIHKAAFRLTSGVVQAAGFAFVPTTTTAPVYLMRTPDYSFGVPGLLLEGAATNLFGNQYTFSGWTTYGVTLTTGITDSPVAGATSTRITFDAGSVSNKGVRSPGILSLIHISEPTRPCGTSRMPSSA